MQPFVVFRKPNQEKVNAYFQQNDDLFYASNFNEIGFIFSPFEDINKTVLIPLNCSERLEFDFVIPAKAEIHLGVNTSISEEKQIHINLVQKGIESISTGVF